MIREITDEQINIVMKRILKAVPLDVDSDNEDERMAQLMILSIEEGYKEKIIELEKQYMDYSKLNKNDKFYCKKILDIIDELSESSKNKISRVLLNKFANHAKREQDGN